MAMVPMFHLILFLSLLNEVLFLFLRACSSASGSFLVEPSDNEEPFQEYKIPTHSAPRGDNRVENEPILTVSFFVVVAKAAIVDNSRPMLVHNLLLFLLDSKLCNYATQEFQLFCPWMFHP